MSQSPAIWGPRPRAQGGAEPPGEPEKDRPDRGAKPGQTEDAPGEPHPDDPAMPEAPPGDLIGPGPENPAGPGAD